MKISEVAHAARLSEDYFERLFRRCIGVPPLRYLISLRLNEARRLLIREPHLSIAEIALKTGIEDPKYLSRLFRDRFGMSPREFRSRRDAGWRAVSAR